jgi:23S rRNA (uracil1939-C5)-methyltransferase
MLYFVMDRIIELEITDLAFNGKSVGYINGKITFVNGGLPGERLEVEIIKSKRRHNEARFRKLLSKSLERIEPVCQHYEICGGCTWQDLDYERQLYYKRKQIVDCLEHIGNFEEIPIDDIRPSPDKFFYRNKMEFSFHFAPVGMTNYGFTLGLHERGRFDSIFDVTDCHLQSEFSNRLVNFLREKVAELRIPIYDLIHHTGFLRFAIVREGKNTGQIMLVLVTGEGEFPQKKKLSESLVNKFPELTSIIWMVNDKKANIARGEIREILFGPPYIQEQILGLRYRISPGSFFQTNSHQTENLYQTAIDMANLEYFDNLLDLYCGSGTIGLCAAGKVKQVIGIDIESEAIKTAEANAQINQISNCRFYAGAARQILASDDFKELKITIVIIDPPRAGMHTKALEHLIGFGVQRLVYISCNPATFARDAALLCKKGYQIEKIIPFDMFPHTMHIELVSSFKKCD